jgi:hypothetical protein
MNRRILFTSQAISVLWRTTVAAGQLERLARTLPHSMGTARQDLTIRASLAVSDFKRDHGTFTRHSRQLAPTKPTHATPSARHLCVLTQRTYEPAASALSRLGTAAEYG